MKGISTILATILIVIIVVALVSLTYTFAVNLFRTSSGGAESSTTELTRKLQQTVDYVTASCDSSSSTDNIKFSIRHTGSVNITVGGLSALLNDNVVTTNPPITAASLNVGEVKSFSISQSVTSSQSIKITVSAPAAPVDKTITCS
jgi:FlaG/FlaF family flagellin (archaellin)